MGGIGGIGGQIGSYWLGGGPNGQLGTGTGNGGNGWLDPVEAQLVRKIAKKIVAVSDLLFICGIPFDYVEYEMSLSILSVI